MRLMVSVKGIMVVAFTTGFLFIYGLGADVLFRHRTFLPSRFEALPRYYLFAVSFTRHAITNPLFYTACSRRCHRDWGKDRSFYPFERRASFWGEHRIACPRPKSLPCESFYPPTYPQGTVPTVPFSDLAAPAKM